MRGSSAGQPRRLSLQAAQVFAASHAPRFFLSFPRGVPLLASLEHSRPCRTLQSFRLCFASGSAPGVHLHPSQVCSHMRAEKAFPHHRAHVPFVHIQLYPIVFIGPNSVTILYWLVSVIRSRRWIRLLGFAPVCGRPRPGRKHECFRPSRGLPALGFLLFQVCGHGGRASSWSRHRNDHEPLIRLPGSDPLLGFWRSLCADVSAITTGKSTSSSCCLSFAGPSAFYEARAWPSRR
jgi:hypothetical protein